MSGFSVADKTLGQLCSLSVQGRWELYPYFAPVILSAAERLYIKTSRALPSASIPVARVPPMATPDFGVLRMQLSLPSARKAGQWLCQEPMCEFLVRSVQ